MLADVYWLGQGDNKFLIENRHYGKIYTPIPESIQPEAQTAEQGGPAPIAPAPKATPESNDAEILQHENANSIKTEAESTPTSTRDRARQKLHDLRGIHRHNNSIYSHHDFLRLRRGSTSDSSGNENDRRRRGRSNTVSANGQDLLEKQMNEMLAKESQDGQAYDDNVTDASHLKPLPARIVHPEQTSQVPRPGHSRKSSRMDIVESLDNTSSEKPNQTPIHSGRASLEVPAHTYRSSVDLDSPRPVISDIVLAGRHNNYMPIIGMDLSPAVSRPGSPVRTPFSKVKSIFRDRSRDREDRESDDRILSPADTIPILTIPKDSTSSLERPRSRSATREFLTKLAHEGHKSHRSMGSLSLRPDDQVGLRTIFKGSAKLDDMIRGGVSKVTDLIWKKDSDASDSSDDDSVDEGQRGRRIGSTLSPGGLARRMEGRRPAKNYMDIMPHFTSASESMDKPISHTPPDGSPAPVLSRPPSRSPRFDQLKPPRIDVRKASLDLSEIEEANGRSVVEYDQSDNDSRSRDPAHPLDRPKQSSKELQNILSIRDSESFASRTEYTTHAPEYRNWAFPKHTPLSQNGLISRREVARLRTLMLCSGIKAMEISRRVTEPHSLLGPQNKVTGSDSTEMSQFLRNGVLNSRMPATELFPATARILAPNIEQSIREFEKSATKFSNETAPKLQERVDTVYGRVAIEYMDMTRRAADDADEVSQDIVDHQRLKVKGVVDAMDKMLRRRRRRFRWVRRGGWLAVEWVVVGFMWYVWFIVTIVRIILGVGRGAVTVVRWLLWL
ncbi:hypothetical protein F4777DRAFT_564272 [Nemania sp. FL0916]|nr:hypothetical protein F4777DRAFT_564272 [Nemania sp. FL0916]